MLSKSLAQLPARFEVLKTRPQFTCFKEKISCKKCGGNLPFLTWPASSIKTKVKCVEGTVALTSLPAVTKVVTTTLYCISRSKAG